ncbi:MAG: DUF2007 domain-containing protein [Pseudomonadota bacterium]
MKLVHTHPSHIVVAQARSALELAGIACVIRHEYASGAMGELAPIDVWPELWVIRDRDHERAQLLVDQSRAEISEADWQCPQCGRECPATFDVCWHCATDRTATGLV